MRRIVKVFHRGIKKDQVGSQSHHVSPAVAADHVKILAAFEFLDVFWNATDKQPDRIDLFTRKFVHVDLFDTYLLKHLIRRKITELLWQT